MIVCIDVVLPFPWFRPVIFKRVAAWVGIVEQIVEGFSGFISPSPVGPASSGVDRVAFGYFPLGVIFFQSEALLVSKSGSSSAEGADGGSAADQMDPFFGSRVV